jgi:quinolinate synthase
LIKRKEKLMNKKSSSIKKLKKEKNSIILVHNYQLPEVQDVADYLGDSLELSLIASRTGAEVIIFCGVHFMAETASIVCPDKKVLLPEIKAGCQMADMITPEKLKELKSKHPEAIVICYVNTSANAVKIVNSVPKDKKIIFIPDKYLADYTSRQTQRELITWEGYCPIHANITAANILNQKKAYPESIVIVHPECKPEVIDLADEVVSTSGMVKLAKKTTAKQIIVGTDIGLIYRLKKENPDKEFYPATKEAVCADMKVITLEKILISLQDMKYEVKVPEEVRKRAIRPVEKMLEVK